MDFLNFIRNNKLVILIVSVVLNVLLVIFGITFIFNYESDCVCEEKVILTENVVEKENSNDFYVEIKGAVKTPGVYLVNSNNIINDVVKLAGGFSKSAYTKNINLSRKVTSELVIYVFTQSEYKKNNKKLEQTVCDCSGYDISNCTNNSASEILSSDKDTNFEEGINEETEKIESSSKKININTATKSDLTSLTGIGNAKAEDIINYRTTNGNFKSIDEIKNVSGIGDALFEKIKENITV